MEVGKRLKHKKYGIGTTIVSDNLSISTHMIKFDNPRIVDKYICLDGILSSELEEVE